MNSSITVLMCVYNGERFLIEQLESLRSQTFQPNEVVIYDDCSDDSSVDIINDFISKYKLESTWRININTSRKGWRLNFYDAIIECNSEYIFFCDQDDIWNPDKIAVMMEAMEKNPNILVLNGLFETIDSAGNPVNILDWTKNNVYNSKTVKSTLEEISYIWKQRLGCTMLIRNIIKDQLKHFICNEYFAHDIWALNVGALLGGCYYINYPVIKYRVHGKNSTAANTVKMLNREERIQKLEGKIEYLKYLHNGINLINKTIIDKKEYSGFLKAIAFYNFKFSSIRNPKITNIFGIFSYLNIYCKYFNFKDFLIDILEALNLRDNVRAIKYSFKNNMKRNTI